MAKFYVRMCDGEGRIIHGPFGRSWITSDYKSIGTLKRYGMKYLPTGYYHVETLDPNNPYRAPLKIEIIRHTNTQQEID